ncbi:MAG: hypothetical protein CMB80_00900 [Flammeovirgaceae bacterium]|nr:hypothetical protein [Flammeovirgaceae bacterium]|tara:strand:+ start:331 stop:1500 length:1170 start_codon:yes stop_codon:yes gene_type:complete
MENIIDTLKSVQGQHPAHRVSFDELYQALEDGCEQGRIFSQEKDGLKLYHYSRGPVYDGLWDTYSLIARGLILCPLEKRIVALSIPKFHNHHELTSWVPPESFTCTEKVDGSLGIIFFHDGKWRASTKGSLCTEQGQWAEKYLNENIDLSLLLPGWTYIVEIIYKGNQIVVPYDFEGLVLITAYTDLGNEIPEVLTYADILGLFKEAGFRFLKVYAFDNVSDIIDRAATLPDTEEGFVLRYYSGYRIKIKGLEYLKKHKDAFNFSPLRVWEKMRDCEDIEVYRKNLPEEFWEDLENYRIFFQDNVDFVYKSITEALRQYAGNTDKEVAAILKQNSLPISVQKFLFAARKKDFFKITRSPCLTRNRMFDLFRPTGNKLDVAESRSISAVT